MFSQAFITSLLSATPALHCFLVFSLVSRDRTKLFQEVRPAAASNGLHVKGSVKGCCLLLQHAKLQNMPTFKAVLNKRSTLTSSQLLYITVDVTLIAGRT